MLERELGVTLPWRVQDTFPAFYRDAELRDVLDSITHINDFLLSRRYLSDAENWRNYASRVFAEEHTTYVLAASGAVTYAVDELYASVRQAALAGLQSPRWTEARTEFERAFVCLDRDPPDTNGAIRAISASVESASKMILGGTVSRVGAAEIDRDLAPKVKALYAGDTAAANAAGLLLKAYADWTSAAHQYRHGQGAPTEGHAPLEIAVNFLSAGSATLRWLIGLNFPGSQPA